MRGKKKKRLKILVPPGMGDIHWIVLKLQSFLEERNAEGEVWIWDVDGRRRSLEYIKRVPFLRAGGYYSEPIGADQETWVDMVMHDKMAVVKDFRGFDYFISFNGTLTHGRDLETEILPEHKANWEYEVTERKKDRVFAERFRKKHGPYMLLFFTNNGMYETHWLNHMRPIHITDFIKRLKKDWPDHTMVLTGLKWDGPFNASLDVPAVNMVGKTPTGPFLSLVRRAAAFIGHCAGNGIMASHFGTPTLMIWSDYFPDRRFQTNWVDPRKVGSTYIPMNVEEWNHDRAAAAVRRAVESDEREIVEKRLAWWPSRGMGRAETKKPFEYDAAYWENYTAYAATETGRELTRRRIALVQKYCEDGEVVDVGIGCGQFLETRGGRTLGYDVNPVAIRWLLDRDRWRDPWFVPPQSVTCWDSLEHMRDPAAFLQTVKEWLLVSIPIFRDREHALKSKHFKPDEHLWYWTKGGLLRWMSKLGFRCVEENKMEQECGREDIGTFVFRRVSGFSLQTTRREAPWEIRDNRLPEGPTSVKMRRRLAMRKTS